MKTNPAASTAPLGLTRNGDGRLVTITLSDCKGVSPKVWNRLRERILNDDRDGKFYPLDTLDVYQDVAHKIVAKARNMPKLKTASPDTYLTKGIRFALMDVWKAVAKERANQRGLICRPPQSELADLDAEQLPVDVRENEQPPRAPFVRTASARSSARAFIPPHAALNRAIAALDSEKKREAVRTYLKPEVDGNLRLVAETVGLRRTFFYETFWPGVLDDLSKLLRFEDLRLLP